MSDKLFLSLITVFSLSELTYTVAFVNLADVECGMEVTRQGRIVGGSDSEASEIPWAASIWRQGAHQCGATVVTHTWLLTAGHCVCSGTNNFYIPRQLMVVAGYHDLAESEDKEALSRILPHPDYRCERTENDVALLETARPLKWAHGLRPACMPQPVAPDYRGAEATVAGWGWTDEDRGKGMRPNVLQKVDVKIVGSDDCTDWYQSQGKKVRITSTQMCAGHEEGGRDSCWADSGGPLMIRDESGRAMLAGVVSTGHGCARARLPGIYTRVSEYMQWIVDNIQGKKANILKGLAWYPK